VADQIRVNFNSLSTAVSDIATGVASAGTRLDDLRAAIAPMVATWQGDAQAAYQVQQTKWDTAWNDLTSALQQFQTATDTSNADYQAGENANTAAWG
jgi:early secretory antigenic target protein ESAT-6